VRKEKAVPNLDPVRRPVSSLPIVARISIPGLPDWVAIDAHSPAIWISNARRGNIARIDPGSNRVVAHVAIGEFPCSGLVAAHGSVWVPCCGAGEVVRVDPGANRVAARIPAPPADSEGAIDADADAVWMPVDGGGLAKIDPRTNEVVSRIDLPAGSFSAATGFGSVWVTNHQGNSVARIDVASGRVVATVPVGRAPRFLTAGFGSVWVLNQGDGTVSRIDPAGNEVTATIAVEVPGNGGDIATGEGGVWVTSLGKPLSRIDPATNQVTVQYVGEGGDALRVGLGSIWLCNFQLQELWRIDPARVGAGGMGD